MTVSPINPLEAALERLAVATWDRLRDIKAFSQRPPPFNSVRLGETTITDLAMLDLCRQGLTRSIFLQTPQHIERLWGTDFEWWLGSRGSGWFRIAVQSKKLDMKQGRYVSLAYKPKGVPQIDTLENYACQNGATALYCLYNYSGEVDGCRHWHCCQRAFRAEELGCSLARPSRVRQAISLVGKRTFDFIHQCSSTLPWQCMATCPRVRDAFDIARRQYRPQHMRQPVEETRPSADPFPLIDQSSYYADLPPFRPRPRFEREFLPQFGDWVDDEMARYDIDVVDYDNSLAEFYNLEVGIPRAINITDLGL